MLPATPNKRKVNKMKTVIAFLLLSQNVFAFNVAPGPAQHVDYDPAKSAMFLACQARSEISTVAPECNALIRRMQSGHLVSENEYRSWCSMAQDRIQTMKKWEAEYKAATKGKKLDYNKCPREALVGN